MRQIQVYSNKKGTRAYPFLWRCMIAWLLIAMYSDTAFAQLKGDKDLLQLVATRYQANRDSILTWVGTAELSDKLSGVVNGEPWVMEWSRIVDFFYDKKADKYSSLNKQLKEFGTKGGKRIENAYRILFGTLRTQEVFYTVGPWSEDGLEGYPKRPLLLIKSRSDESSGDFSNEFDPFRYYGIQGQNASAMLTAIYQKASNPAFSVFTVSRKGNKVILNNNDTAVTWNYVFDLDQGGNPVEVEAKDSLVESKWTCIYEEVSGIWVPKRSTAKNNNLSSKKINERVVNWTRNIVNQTITEDKFTVEWLGLRSGDTARDVRVGAEYIYDESPKQSGFRKQWPIIIVAIVVACAILLLLLGYRRRTRSRQPTS